MSDHDDDDTVLDGLFNAARRDAHDVPDDALLARVMADAQRLQPTGPAAMPLSDPEPAPRRRQGLMQMLGGWPALAGLASVAVAGVWIGLSPPAALDQAGSEYFMSTELLGDDDVLYGFDVLLAEG